MIKRIIKDELSKIMLNYCAEKQLGAAPQFSVEDPPKGIYADIATNAAMQLAKSFKLKPREVAAELSQMTLKALGNKIKSVDIAGAGFLNISFSDEFIFSILKTILDEAQNFGRSKTGNGKKALVEFVSANPTGPLHIGHGRGAAIGDSLARILSFLGFDVVREYYLNNVGNQMEMLGASVEARYNELKGKPVSFPQDGYKGDYIKDIAGKYDELSGKTFKEFAIEEIMKTITDDLKTFSVSFNSWFPESDLAAKKDPKGFTEVDRVCAWLKEKNFAYDKEGALWFTSSAYGDDKDRVLKRSDGRYTYLASDIAYHKNKIERKFDILIDIWGADHHGYVPRMHAAISCLGAEKGTLNVILYQLVSLLRGGQAVAMSTRSGEFVTLKEVLNEVGSDACRFFFMMRAPDSHLDFDLELAKKQSSENPVFYVQYVYARCSSIFREAGKDAKIDFTNLSALNADLSLLRENDEKNLIKQLAGFPETLELCLGSMSPHHITKYLTDLADAFHKFYEKCRVLGVDTELCRARLCLLKAASIVIKNGLFLLGVSSPEKM